MLLPPHAIVGALSSEQQRVFNLGIDALDVDIACSQASVINLNLTGEPSERVKEAFNFLTSSAVEPQLTGFQASVVIGTMQAESGMTLNPEALNASGAFGIAQWLGPRKIGPLGLDTFAAKQSKPMGDFNVQLLFLKHEWMTTENKAYTNLKNQANQTASGIDKAVKDYESDFERSGGVAVNMRQAYAKAIFAKLGSLAPTTTQLATTVSDTSTVSGDECAQSAANPTSGCSVTAPIKSDWGYSEPTLIRLFGDHGTADSHPIIDSKLVTVDFLGKKVRVHTLAAGCLSAVANDLKASTYKIRMMGCYRFDGNGFGQIGTKSYHTYGVACDINWDTNPYTTASSAPYDIPKEFVTAFRNHGWTWGGDWGSIKDYMHFQFDGVDPNKGTL